jgi:hypothetical protein
MRNTSKISNSGTSRNNLLPLKSNRHRYAQTIINFIKRILERYPLYTKTLLNTIKDSFMHHKKNRMHFLFYIKNIVHLMVEVPKLEFGILDLILKRVLQMDSELPQSKKTLYGETLNSFNTQNFSEDDLLFKIDRVLQILFIYLQESLGIKKLHAVPPGNRIYPLKINRPVSDPSELQQRA